MFATKMAMEIQFWRHFLMEETFIAHKYGLLTIGQQMSSFLPMEPSLGESFRTYVLLSRATFILWWATYWKLACGMMHGPGRPLWRVVFPDLYSTSLRLQAKINQVWDQQGCTLSFEKSTKWLGDWQNSWDITDIGVFQDHDKVNRQANMDVEL